MAPTTDKGILSIPSFHNYPNVSHGVIRDPMQAATDILDICALPLNLNGNPGGTKTFLFTRWLRCRNSSPELSMRE